MITHRVGTKHLVQFNETTLLDPKYIYQEKKYATLSILFFITIFRVAERYQFLDDKKNWYFLNGNN